MLRSLQVHHEIQVAHRLMSLEGKCRRIHGHSMKVTMELYGEIDLRGILIDDLAHIKSLFRTYLDSTYDHSLLLNGSDPLCDANLPGAVILDEGDPTVENLSEIIARWSMRNFPAAKQGRILVHETGTNTCIAEWLRGVDDVIDGDVSHYVN